VWLLRFTHPYPSAQMRRPARAFSAPRTRHSSVAASRRRGPSPQNKANQTHPQTALSRENRGFSPAAAPSLLPNEAIASLSSSSRSYNHPVPGEFDFIDWIRSQQSRSELVQIPAGDDLAVLKWPADDLLIVGADQVLDGVHFDSAVHIPRAIGRKAMNRNLSDCAAMACLPAAAIATVALPRGSDLEYAKELYLGLKEAGDAFGVQIVGGETGSWPQKLALSVTILGRSAGVQPVTRSGARPDDQIYVTGALGGSILGRHMTFIPRVQLARELVRACKVTAMIDLSDGLSRDLGQICKASGVGAVVEAIRIPIHDDVMKLPADGRWPLDHALSDGEDYELLFTSPRCEHPAAIRIGTIVEGRHMALQGPSGAVRLEPKGWEHQL
jgi:thiamine-monophosphate kinase